MVSSVCVRLEPVLLRTYIAGNVNAQEIDVLVGKEYHHHSRFMAIHEGNLLYPPSLVLLGCIFGILTDSLSKISPSFRCTQRFSIGKVEARREPAQAPQHPSLRKRGVSKGSSSRMR